MTHNKTPAIKHTIVADENCVLAHWDGYYETIRVLISVGTVRCTDLGYSEVRLECKVYFKISRIQQPETRNATTRRTSTTSCLSWCEDTVQYYGSLSNCASGALVHSFHGTRSTPVPVQLCRKTELAKTLDRSSGSMHRPAHQNAKFWNVLPMSHVDCHPVYDSMSKGNIHCMQCARKRTHKKIRKNNKNPSNDVKSRLSNVVT